MTDKASDTSVSLKLTALNTGMHETNPTFDGLAEELVNEILEYALTYKKPLHEVRPRVLARTARAPLQLSLLRVNKSIHRLAIDIFYARNDFAVNFNNLEIGQPPVHFASRLPGILSNKPLESIPVLQSAIFRPLNMTHLTIEHFGLIDRSFHMNDDADRDVKTFTGSLLAYFKASAHLKTLTISCVSATDFLNLWKELQTYDATATEIGKIQIPKLGCLVTLQFPDLIAAWGGEAGSDTAWDFDEIVDFFEHGIAFDAVLAPFFEVSPVDYVARLRLQRKPGEPKRFLAFNLALLTRLMFTEVGSSNAYVQQLPGVRSRGGHWVWREGTASDQIGDYNEEPDVPNSIYKRTMKESWGWYGDADWSGDEVWYNQLCTEVDFRSGSSLGEVEDDGQHTGEKWLRSFWKTSDEFDTFSLYAKKLSQVGPRQMDPIRGILRK